MPDINDGQIYIILTTIYNFKTSVKSDPGIIYSKAIVSFPNNINLVQILKINFYFCRKQNRNINENDNLYDDTYLIDNFV